MAYDNSRHKALVKRVCEENNAETLGFAKACRKLEWWDCEDYGAVQIVPDVWRIDHERQLIEIWEVVITSRLKGPKLHKTIDLWDRIDYYSPEQWQLRVYVVDEFGAQSCLDLCEQYLEQLPAAAAA